MDTRKNYWTVIRPSEKKDYVWAKCQCGTSPERELYRRSIERNMSRCCRGPLCSMARLINSEPKIEFAVSVLVGGRLIRELLPDKKVRVQCPLEACGKEAVVSRWALAQGVQCICQKRKNTLETRIKNGTYLLPPGSIHHKWTILRPSENNNKVWAQCSCGSSPQEVSNGSIIQGKSRSCGCDAETNKAETNKERYGHSHVLHVPKFKEAVVRTNLDKYGTANPAQADRIKKKIRTTNLSKYGTENAMQNLSVAMRSANGQRKTVEKKNWETGEAVVCCGSYEAAFVEYWNVNRIRYKWQHRVFEMSNGYTYRPDAYLPDQDLWVEIKGYFRKDAKEKWEWFHFKNPNSELWGKEKLIELGLKPEHVPDRKKPEAPKKPKKQFPVYDVKVGDKFGRWVVVSLTDSVTYVIVKCDCKEDNSLVQHRKSALVKGRTKGCILHRGEHISSGREAKRGRAIPVGYESGSLVVTGRMGTRYLCKCTKCGKTDINLHRVTLKRKVKQDCGCGTPSPFFVGKQFSHWTVIDIPPTGRDVICRCDCAHATVRAVKKYSLLSGESQSCDCAKSAAQSIRGTDAPKFKVRKSPSYCFQYERRLITEQEDRAAGMRFDLRPNDFTLAYEAMSSEHKEFIARYEWLGKVGWGVKWVYTARHEGHLAGVVMISEPTAFSAFGRKHGTELEALVQRGACASWAPKNLNSRLLMFACRHMVANTKKRLFVAYSDPAAKEIGTIYQACNWDYLGTDFGNKTMYRLPDGRFVGGRYFTRTASMRRWAKELGIEWKKEWLKPNGYQNVSAYPDEIKKALIDYAKQKRSECTVEGIPGKGKYALLLGSNKSEQKRLNKLKEWKSIPYPKR